MRATAEPQSGREPPGHGSSRVWPKPWARRPSLTVCERSQSSRPSFCISPIARGVRPSPHVLSRGKVAASTSTTSSPARAAQAAAADPAGPAPTTRTSAEVGRAEEVVTPEIVSGTWAVVGTRPRKTLVSLRHRLAWAVAVMLEE